MATSYNILRLSDWNVGYVPIAKGITDLNYTDSSSLINGTTYYYMVIAVNLGGTSVPSNQVTAVATTTGNYTFPVYIYGSGTVQYSYLSANGQTMTGTLSSNGSITVAAGTQVTLTSTPNDGHKFYQYFIPFNGIYYATNSVQTFNVTGNNYVNVAFQ
ncbi:MAG: hypothetical protein HQL15_10785 [Candidatus Omnitrophica bacterium]|nr:hypothetical protein [Candidatus Omnitrophota bacterium]